MVKCEYSMFLLVYPYLIVVSKGLKQNKIEVYEVTYKRRHLHIGLNDIQD